MGKDRNLLGLGKATSSDPFVEVWFGGKMIDKTQVVKKNLSPTWNKYFTIDLGSEDVESIHLGRSGFEHLSLRIFDYDKVTAHDFMGVCKVPITTSMQPNACWYKVLKEDGDLRCKNATGEVEVKIIVQKRIID